jgi:hypothetical protein
MQIVAEEIDGSYYVDLIISPSELKRIKKNEMVSAQSFIKKKNYHVGVQLRGKWDFYEEEDDEE